MVYGLLGFENWGVECSGTVSTAGKSVSGNMSGRVTALRIGVGASYKFDENWSGRLDLLYSIKKEKELNKDGVTAVLSCGKFEIRALAAYNF